MKEAPYLYLEVPLPPSVNSIWRSVGKRVYRSKKYTDWLTEAGWCVAQQAKGAKVPGFVGVSMKFARPDKRRRDLDNLVKATGDMLVQNRIIEDDSMIMRLEAEWVMSGAPAQIMVISTKEVA